MIKELLSDLVNTLSAVPELSGRVGAVVGGTSQDPELMKVPVPFGWVIFTGDQNLEPEQGADYQRVLYAFSVMVGVSYGADETDFLDNQITILDKMRKALLGKTPFKYADQWQYDGCTIDSAKAGRLIYKLNFSVIGYHTEDQNP